DRAPASPDASAARDPLAHALLGFEQLGCEGVAEVRGLVHTTDLDHRTVRHRRALHPRDRLVLRLDLPEPEPGDQFLRLGERTIDDGALARPERDACAGRTGL